MHALLAAMATGQWRHGYDLMKETGVLSGTLYPLLIRMTDQGLVEAQWREPEQPGRPPRHALGPSHCSWPNVDPSRPEICLLSHRRI